MSAQSHDNHGPLAQFEVNKLFDLQLAGFDISFTNSALYMVISTILIIGLMLFATRKKSLIPSKAQVIAESVYGFLHDMIKGSIGEEGEKFFPLIFTLFTFIFMCNLLGLTPYSFTATSQLPITLAMALISFFTVTIFAIVRNGVGGFLHMFLPSGVPILIAPVIFILELFSFLVRPATLSLRLCANMVAGHVLLKVIAGFIISLGVIFGTMPFIFALAMMGFEFFVAGIQAYIFAILVCAYLGDVVKEH